MGTRSHALRLATLLLTIGLLAACPRPATPTPTPLPPTLAPPTDTPEPAPAGWIDHAAGTARLALPADWQVLDLSAGDAAALFASFQASNPDLAALIGNVEALQGAALWAYHSAGPAASFSENVNVRRFDQGTTAAADLAAAIEPIVAQYRELGFIVTATRTDLQIDSLPAAYIAYTLPFARANGQAMVLHGYQYLIASPTETWILSYAAGSETAAEMAPVFEQSARTFRVK